MRVVSPLERWAMARPPHQPVIKESQLLIRMTCPTIDSFLTASGSGPPLVSISSDQFDLLSSEVEHLRAAIQKSFKSFCRLCSALDDELRPDDTPAAAPPPATLTNFWDSVEQYFKPIPTDDELRPILEPAADVSLNLRSPAVHWSKKISSLAEQGAAKLPGPAPRDGDVCSFWRTARVPFPLEAAQTRNGSLLNGLLGALVAVDPAAMAGTGDGATFDCDHPIQLLPELTADHYLAMDFEYRLRMELEAVGMIDEGGGGLGTGLDEEISEMKRQLEKIRQQLNPMKEQIADQLPDLRTWQNDRVDRLAIYQNCAAAFGSRRKRFHG